MEPLCVNPANLAYHALIGVGGIGTGEFFALEGNHTLGREESRAGHFVDQRDYCKLHIITHYIQVLLGSAFRSILIGRVGDDHEGRQLLGEMATAGLDVRYVEVVAGGQTLFSFCFVYPDGSGGNLTTNDSVNATVDHTLVDEAIPDFREYRGQGIALAAPEAPLSARLHLLELATEYNFYRTSSMNSLEITSPEGAAILSLTDLLAINADEAAALAGIAPETMRTEQGVKKAIKAALQYQPDIAVSVTSGKEGSWVWDGHDLQHVPAVVVEAVNTAGAGDAHFAGLLVGLAAGLSLSQAHELAALVAALSVLSPHTIHPTLDCVSLKALADRQALHLNNNVVDLLSRAAMQDP